MNGYRCFCGWVSWKTGRMCPQRIPNTVFEIHWGCTVKREMFICISVYSHVQAFWNLNYEAFKLRASKYKRDCPLKRNWKVEVFSLFLQLKMLKTLWWRIRYSAEQHLPPNKFLVQNLQGVQVLSVWSLHVLLAPWLSFHSSEILMHRGYISGIITRPSLYSGPADLLKRSWTM